MTPFFIVHNEDQVKQFDFINSRHDIINFTSEGESDRTLATENNEFNTTVYRK